MPFINEIDIAVCHISLIGSVSQAIFVAHNELYQLLPQNELHFGGPLSHVSLKTE